MQIRSKYNKMEYCLGNGFELFSNVANHAWQNNHSIDFDNAYVIDRGNYRVRKTPKPKLRTRKTNGSHKLSKIKTKNSRFVMFVIQIEI